MRYRPLRFPRPIEVVGQLVIGLGAVALGLSTPTLIRAQDGVTVDDLVRRVRIPLAALSPDGRYAAWLLARGNPLQDVYEINIRVIDTERKSDPTTLQEYTLSPSEAFNDVTWFQPSAGELHWTSDDLLVFTMKSDGKMRMAAWNPQDHQTRILLERHDRIEFDADNDKEDRFSVVTTDFVDQPIDHASAVRDNAWRIRDDDRFYGPLTNPKMGRWAKRQKWSLSLRTDANMMPDSEPSEGWESSPEDWKEPPPKMRTSVTTTDDERTMSWDATPSPNGKLVAMVEEIRSNLRQPGASVSTARIIVKEGGSRRALTLRTRPRLSLSILGWSSDSRIVYYLSGGPQESSLNAVTLTGKVRVLIRELAELQKPGFLYARSECQALSRDGRYALLVRSTNVMPGELVKIDVKNGAVTTLESPNDVFTKRSAPSVRFYQIEGAGGEAWGRLYLPLQYKEGNRYPMVITQYISTPGYEAGQGDEAPILPLTANGIAVFAMHSLAFEQISSVGDFRLDISRVQRPLEGMEWMYRKLVADGIVDSSRVGLTGLSYGAEIAMYAYWKSTIFRAVSSTTASWDPPLYFFGGVEYASQLEHRGFPVPDENGLPLWRELSAALNARATLPPLLFQSPDGEEAVQVPAWVQLRRAGARVEWYVYPNEGHIKQSPANKWWVFERNLDWFRFWLQDYEDPNPAKREQYARWRQMREQQAAVLKQQGASH